MLVSYASPLQTVKTNIIGTANLFESLKKYSFVKSVVIATTDKVYLNLEKKKPFKEDDSLGGHDIYSGSKAATEIISKL